MHFPDGTTRRGRRRRARRAIHSTSGTIEIHGRVVEGPWKEPLSQLAGKPVRLARADHAGAGMKAPVTLVSDGSLARVAREAGRDEVDPRRFRMLFEIEGCDAHEEDIWDGTQLRGGLGRCCASAARSIAAP